jgi:hypothetical protein
MTAWYNRFVLVFVDESGDTGLKAGASTYFTVCIVIFDNHEAARSVDTAITELRRKISKNDTLEFHFQSNSNNQRLAFLRAMSTYNFRCLAFVVDKSRLKPTDWKSKASFYKQVCKWVFETATKYGLTDADVKIDNGGDQTFNKDLSDYLRSQLNSLDRDKRCLRTVGFSDSRGDNLLQLADTVCGAVARSFSQVKVNAGMFREIIKHSIVSVDVRP